MLYDLPAYYVLDMIGEFFDRVRAKRGALELTNLVYQQLTNHLG